MRKYKSIAIVVVALLAVCLALATPSFADDMLNVNTATAAQLEEIKGLGEKTARKIVEYRKEHGAFASLDDLIQVKG
ncbi:MAG: helix-hairpin-helix domain-containing protein, partial [Mariprofundaceae bacterium]